jgi:HprK-related kinase A
LHLQTKLALQILTNSYLDRLERGGLTLAAYPFVFRIRSESHILARALLTAYGDFEVCDPSSLIDFDLAVVPVSGLRRWVSPLIQIEVDGNQPFSPLPESQAFPLLEWAMNWIVTSTAHQYLMCHSAVLASENLAVILPAPPGSGKSTLCAALMMSGWRLLSDELALIDPMTGDLTPFVRPVSLKNTSIAVISGNFAEAVFTDSVTDTIKGTVAHLKPTQISVRQSKTNASPRWLIFPTYSPSSSFELRPIGPAEAVVELARNAFNLPVLGVKGFNALVSVVEKCDCFQLTYSNLSEAIDQFDLLITNANRSRETEPAS